MELILWILMTTCCIVFGIGAYIYIKHKADFDYALATIHADMAALKLKIAQHIAAGAVKP